MRQINTLLVGMGLILLGLNAFAVPATSSSDLHKRFFSFELPTRPEKSRNDLWPPLATFLLPGFDQWVEFQYPSATMYSSIALGGLALAAPASERLKAKSIDLSNLSNRDDDVRTVQLGSQIYMAAGSFSAYHSFRSAVRSRKHAGGYAFLANEESVDELWTSPFHFELLARPTTYLPLGGLFALMVYGLSSDGEMFKNNSYRVGDAGFAGAASYLAGTNEEALFRGWMMPMLMERWQSPFWSNTATAVIFGAAHLSANNTFPLAQFAAGWYFGYLSQANGWTLRESIFVHAWWDVIAFTGSYLYESRDKRKDLKLYLPLLAVEY